MANIFPVLKLLPRTTVCKILAKLVKAPVVSPAQGPGSMGCSVIAIDLRRSWFSWSRCSNKRRTSILLKSTIISTCVDRLIDTIEKKINFKIDVQQNWNLRHEQANSMSSRKAATGMCVLRTLLSETPSRAWTTVLTLSRNLWMSSINTRGGPRSAGINCQYHRECTWRQNMLHLLEHDPGVWLIGDQDLIAFRTACLDTPIWPRPPQPAPPPVIIQFANKRIRNAILSKRKDLKRSKITLTEQLKSTRAALLRKGQRARCKPRRSKLRGRTTGEYWFVRWQIGRSSLAACTTLHQFWMCFIQVFLLYAFICLLTYIP